MSDAKYRTEFPSSAAPSDPLIRPLSKGLGPLDQALAGSKISGRRWNLLHEDLSLPTAVLYEDKLEHNLEWMRKFAEGYGVKLAPHGKTTMAPKLFMRQLEAGAWGITLATAPQVRAAYEHGIRRVLMANQLIGRQNMATVARLLDDPGFEFFCLVDSAELVANLGYFFQDRGRRLNVLVELGVDDGRTGVRNSEQLGAVVAALSQWKGQIALCGVEVYEGVLKDEGSIRSYLQHALEVTRQLAGEGRFDHSPVILSGAGSAWYDVVADVFAKAKIGQPIEVLLRPGCYLTHDVGIYREAQEQIKVRNPVAQRIDSSLVPALQLWAYVQSIPESKKAILGLGKRDAAFDAGLPVPALHYRPGQPTPLAAPGAWQLTKMMDQHAYMQIPEGSDIRVGDMIGLDISHPCLTFDKWRYLPVVDSKYQVMDVVETFF
jgi:D-serine dehydratase